MDYCLTTGGRMTASAFLIGGAWARELYIRQFSSLPNLRQGDLKPDYLDGKAIDPTILFADCIVRSAPANADYLLRVPATSPQEDAAIKNLAPILGKCVDSGTQFKISRLSFRLGVANAMYRRAMGYLRPVSTEVAR